MGAIMNRLLAILILCCSLPVFATQPEYVNLKSQFKSFVEKAQGRDFEAQLEIWQMEVESALPEIYAKILSRNPNKTVEQSRRDRASKWFPFMFAHADRILAQFDSFDRDGWPLVQRLVKKYPQVDFSDVRVIAMPSFMSFNGQVLNLEDSKMVAMFGADFLELVEENSKLIEGADLINNTSVLVAHEFTHVLFGKILESIKEDYSKFGLWADLWNEGLAQMHSQILVPGSDLTTVLMERNLAAKCTATQVSEWARLFIDDAAATSEAEQAARYGKWFLMNSWQTLGVARAGYCLGYHAVLIAMREHSFIDLLNMNPSEAYIVVKNAVAEIADSQ